MKPTLEAAKHDFVHALMLALQTVKDPNGRLLSVKTAALVNAHGAYESGWGRAKAATDGFNFWNLTAGPSWQGEVTFGADTEYRIGLNTPKPITQRFRRYSSPTAAATDYLRFLSTPRYSDGLQKLLLGDASFVEDLGTYRTDNDGHTLIAAWTGVTVKGGFYTLPIEQYVARYNAVLVEVEWLSNLA